MLSNNCTDGAICEVVRGVAKCVCPKGMSGDGLIGPGHTGCAYPPCPGEFVKFDNNCYQNISEYLSHDEAEKKCENLGGTLVSVHSLSELNFLLVDLVPYLDTPIWIGLDDILFEGTFLWNDQSIGLLPFTDFDLSTNSDENDCVVLKDGVQFEVANCSTPSNFICKRALYKRPCKDGYTELDGACYAFVRQPNVTFFQAYMNCTLSGGDLASVHTTNLYNDINLDSVNYDIGLWLGLQNNFTSNETYWTDATDTSFIESFLGMNLELDPAETCYVAAVDEWHAMLCTGDKADGFVCKKPFNRHKSCPGESVRFGDQCYKVKTDRLPWEDAREKCTSMGADLVSITSVAMQLFVRKLIQARGEHSDYWIGLKERHIDGDYYWTDHSSFVYMKWARNQPNENSPHNCVRLKAGQSYTWDDSSCEDELSYICKYNNTPCTLDEHCHSNAICYMGQCRCKTGYYGDGKDICNDVDECSIETCSPDANCTNSVGSFNCACREGFVGNGITCTNILSCSSSVDCHRYGECNMTSRLCQCLHGYRGNGKLLCDNIDECEEESHDCSPHAECTDRRGYFLCHCRRGYNGDGRFCQQIPKHCQEVFDLNSQARSGVYTIDPDMVGGEPPFKVYCDFRSGVAVTRARHSSEREVYMPSATEPRAYIHELLYYYRVTQQQLLALMNVSEFCYQDLSIKTIGFTAAGNTAWEDGNNTMHLINQCPCAEINACDNRDPVCDANTYIRIMDKGSLPIAKLHLGGSHSNRRLKYYVTSLKCAQQQIDIPVDCDEAKVKYRLREDRVMYIDTDDINNVTNLRPFLVKCRVTPYPHVGVTTVPLKWYHDMTQIGVHHIEYSAPLELIYGLISRSAYCYQEITYTCKNSLLLHGGSYWNSTLTGRQSYWGSAVSESGACACGIRGICVNDASHSCECDVQDGKQRQDFGVLNNKADLPVGSVTIRGGSASATVGDLHCSVNQFGILPSCQDYANKGLNYSYAYLVDPDGARRGSRSSVAPLLVRCEMRSPYVGCSIVPIDKKNLTTKLVSKRSAYCEKWPENDSFLRCCELWRSCAELYHRYRVVYGIHRPRDGLYTIDVDKSGPLQPFRVYCDFPYKTIIKTTGNRAQSCEAEPGNNGTTKECSAIEYGNGLSIQQLKNLTKVSPFCRQSTSYECRSARWTGNVEVKDSNGFKLNNWGGAPTNSSQCACGTRGACADNVSLACECDANSTAYGKDFGYLIDKNVLPVVEICLRCNASTILARYTIGDLVCASTQFDIERTCQRTRTHRRKRSDGVYWIDPDGSSGREKPFPAYCDMERDVPYGITVITHQYFNECIRIPPEGADIHFQYNHTTLQQLKELTKRSVYCKQELSYSCKQSDLVLGGAEGYGWYNVDEELMPNWGGNTNGTGCYGGVCRCSSLSAEEQTDGGLLLNHTVLPVTRVKIAPQDNDQGERCVTLGPLKCYTVYRHCEELRQYEGIRMNGFYPLDSDQVDLPDGGEEVYWGYCDLTTVRGMGITQIFTEESGIRDIAPDSLPGEHIDTIHYRHASNGQLRALVLASQTCKQELQYLCRNLSLLNNFDPFFTDFETASGSLSISWSGADAYGVRGCACAVLGTCPSNDTCRCDSWTGPDFLTEGGFVTNREILPITRVRSGGTVYGGDGSYHVGFLACSPRHFGLPVDCEDARRKGYATGEHLIQPTQRVRPFLVFCDMTSVPFTGITIIYNNMDANFSINGAVNVTYKAASLAQVAALVDISAKCYQPIRYNCYSSQFLGSVTYDNYWEDEHGRRHKYFGGGNGNQCSCGKAGRCGGHDGMAAMRERHCNCDIGDNQTRADAGVLDIKDDLPIAALRISTGDRPEASGSVTIGSLRCARRSLVLDECQLGFADCHMWADCVRERDGFDCQCRPGYQGLGVPGVWANGRECYDDDECVSNVCPNTAHCVNVPGSFECVCKDGFRQTGPMTCADVNECVLGTHDCDVNATCRNTFGSYTCSCRRGFKGTGRRGQCFETGTCSCWGDPHCFSFDSAWNHFQGACTYTMVRDGCLDGLPYTQESFHITQTNYRKPELVGDMAVSWPEKVTIYVYGHYVELMPDGQARLDSILVRRLPSRPLRQHEDFVIAQSGEYVTVSWGVPAIEVYWKPEKVIIYVPVLYKERVCGLCGNYNDLKDDDWRMGHECPGRAGEITGNVNQFGNSWTYDIDICVPDCNATVEPLCDGESLRRAERECHLLLDFDGPFQTCLNATEGDEELKRHVQHLYDSCLFDMCLVSDARQGMCSHAEALVEFCQDLGLRFSNWRAGTKCGKQCDEDKFYSNWASPCQPTCVDPTRGHSNCSLQNREMCVCGEGMVLDGSRCVKLEECGCDDGQTGMYYSVGDKVVNDDCSEQCYCRSPGGDLECRPLACEPGRSTCRNKDGVVDCHCHDGYNKTDGEHCEDIDECLRTGACHVHAECTNTNGSYECNCSSGFVGNGFNCTDIDECRGENHGCDQNADCINHPGSFSCKCREGFVMVGNICEDVDECETQNDCQLSSTYCENHHGSYSCECQKPEAMVRLNDHECADLDECRERDTNDCHANATCYNSIFSYSCMCDSGFEDADPNHPGRNCTDVDECSHDNRNGCHEDADCTNTIGSYTCQCKRGYEGDGRISCEGLPGPVCDEDCRENEICVAASVGENVCRCKHGFVSVPVPNSRNKCVDIDECLNDIHLCSVNAKCINKQGSYDCSCNQGFLGDGFTCKDIPECEKGLDACDEHAHCHNTVGSYRCECFPGFEGNGHTCQDVDECARNTAVCGRNTKCVNTEGSYYCSCLKGYMGNCQNCEDINECSNHLDNCHSSFGRCKNTQGSFICKCKYGYEGDGVECVDIDECATGDHRCGEHSRCKNEIGSYSCECYAGWVAAPNDLICRDVNECSTSEYECDVNARCLNTEGSYKCECLLGYYGDGFTCTEDEKGTCGDSFCDNLARCEFQEDGSRTCVCVPGFYGPGNITANRTKGCYPEDPCINNTVCHSNADCIAVTTLAVCICKSGYQGNGKTCEEIDPCFDDFICGSRATCVNQGGGNHNCTCDEGYEDFDGNGCQDIDECEVELICGENSVCYNTQPGYQCDCKPGYDYNEENLCVDVDECASTRHDCDEEERAVCTNTEGDYTCACADGFTGDGYSCTETGDEGCEASCGEGQICRLSFNHSSCICRSGFVPDPNNLNNCVDVNECLGNNNCHEKASCTNRSPGYNCSCLAGYYGNGFYCGDINECFERTDNCHENATCSNTIGGFECNCNFGFHGDGVTCVIHSPDDDICGCGAHGTCESETGRCRCEQGFRAVYTLTTNKCVDVDECLTSNPCHPLANCYNTHGGYDCVCLEGMVGDGAEYCDVDACATGEAVCSPWADCLYSFGYHSCVCWQGYTGDGLTCTKLADPCSGDVCGNNTICVSVRGEALCECKSGYYGDGETCRDINECRESGIYKHKCHTNAVCHNLEGSYVCKCSPGFIGNGKHCEDIDECSELSANGRGRCSGQSDCRNTIGGYRCSCKKGLVGNGFRCRPGPACEEECVKNARCRSTAWGARICRCRRGFQGDGTFNCTDINECDDVNDCDENAICKNLSPGYSCACKEGFVGNGKHCSDINECIMARSETCREEHMTCRNTIGSFECNCDQGFEMVNGSCVDVDECAENVSTCHANATCHNTMGGFKCICKNSYYGDGLTCEECNNGTNACRCPEGLMYEGGTCVVVNSCALSQLSVFSHNCSNADCYNMNPGFRCDCHGGFESINAYECTDVDECSNDPLLCRNGRCVNVPGSYACHCATGFVANDQVCEDADECQYPNICGDPDSNYCENIEGSFLCHCRHGFEMNNGSCEDKDECLLIADLCGEEALCINTYGAYECHCPTGFKIHDGRCHNINECESRNACHENADCRDNDGSYTCQCHIDYIGDGRICAPICSPDTCRHLQTCRVVDHQPVCECRCDADDCVNEGPVCGTDGQTYDSDADLLMYACEANKEITRDYRGRCQTSCNTTICGLYETCVIHRGIPQCICDQCTEQDRWPIEVCTVNGFTFPSKCVFKTIQCRTNGNDVIDHMGPCRHPHDCKSSHWSPWSGCDVTCGSGHRRRSRVVIEEPRNGGKACGPLVQKTHCYMPACVDNPCANHTCERPGSRCVVHRGKAVCRCTSCRREPLQELCGLLNGQQVSRPNLCRLQKQACMRGTDCEVLHNGHCIHGEPNEPVNCTSLPYYTKLRDEAGCVSRNTIRVNICKGGCGTRTGHCCFPERLEYHNHPFTCTDSQDDKMVKVAIIAKCRCITEDRRIQFEQLKPLTEDEDLTTQNPSTT